MLLNDFKICSAKPSDKAYTLNDDKGLSLIISPTGVKGWRFRYQFGGKTLAILEKLEVLTGNYKLVFPGRNDAGKPMSEASINKVIKMLVYHGRATGHGFRHTMSTILHEKGYNSAWIETQLAHVDKNSIRGTYNHAQYLEGRREMLEWYGDYTINVKNYKNQTSYN